MLSFTENIWWWERDNQGTLDFYRVNRFKKMKCGVTSTQLQLHLKAESLRSESNQKSGGAPGKLHSPKPGLHQKLPQTKRYNLFHLIKIILSKSDFCPRGGFSGRRFNWT